MTPTTTKYPALFDFFYQINKIPRPSYREDKIADYLVEFANSKNYFVQRDSHNNVIIKKPASKGLEDMSPITLQSHIDMVCVKKTGCEKDLSTSGIEAYIDGDWIKAKDTSLGADDGSGMAMMLAVLSDDSLIHPALECLFTASEEVGLIGAAHLDMTCFEGQTLINLDSEQEGVFTLGCAGGGRMNIEKTYESESFDSICYTITLEGFTGGHSGINIHHYRANACVLLGHILMSVSKITNLRILHINGGGFDNAIPSGASAHISFPDKDFGKVDEAIKNIADDLLDQYKITDPQGQITFLKNPNDTYSLSLSQEDSKDLLRLLLSLPNGVIRMSSDIEGLVETSLNLGILSYEEGVFKLTYLIRSSVPGAYAALKDNMMFLAESFAAGVTMEGEYPAWPYSQKSSIREKAVALFKKMYGKEPVLEVVHAGLECGILQTKHPADAISIGPDIVDVHSVDERMSVSSFERTYEFLLNLIKS